MSRNGTPVKVAVLAHAGKSFGDGLLGLRRELERQGIDDPLWFEVPKSRKAPPQAERALEAGAELVFVWGGDGMVQRCVDVLAGSDARLAIVPAGTANLLAGNLDERLGVGGRRCDGHRLSPPARQTSTGEVLRA